MTMTPSGSTIAFHEFLLNFKPAEQAIHIFFEGAEDMSFYMPRFRARSVSMEATFTYKTGKKKDVLYVATLVDQRIRDSQSPQKSIFVVDKDLDDILQTGVNGDGRLVFETNLYSIENYLVNRSNVEVFCQEILKISPNVAHRIGNEFDALIQSYYPVARELMIYIIFHRLNTGRPNLNNITGGEIYEYQSGKWRFFRLSSQRIVTLDKHLGVATDFSKYLKQRGAIRKRLSAYSFKQYVRGKYELFFLIAFLKQIVRDHSCKSVHPLIPASLCEILAARSPDPAGFAGYVSARLS